RPTPTTTSPGWCARTAPLIPSCTSRPPTQADLPRTRRYRPAPPRTAPADGHWITTASPGLPRCRDDLHDLLVAGLVMTGPDVPPAAGQHRGGPGRVLDRDPQPDRRGEPAEHLRAAADLARQELAEVLLSDPEVPGEPCLGGALGAEAVFDLAAQVEQPRRGGCRHAAPGPSGGLPPGQIRTEPAPGCPGALLARPARWPCLCALWARLQASCWAARSSSVEPAGSALGLTAAAGAPPAGACDAGRRPGRTGDPRPAGPLLPPAAGAWSRGEGDGAPSGRVSLGDGEPA